MGMGEKVIGPGGARVPVPLVTSQSQPWPPDQLPGGDRGLFTACLATAENSGLGNPANPLTSGRLQSYLFQIGFNLIGRVPLLILFFFGYSPSALGHSLEQRLAN